MEMNGLGKRGRQLQPFERVGPQVVFDPDAGRPGKPRGRAAGTQLREFGGEQIADEPVQRRPVIPPSPYGAAALMRYDASTAFIFSTLPVDAPPAKSEAKNASTTDLANSGPITRAPKARICASLLLRARSAL
jgi:hypothetical protein